MKESGNKRTVTVGLFVVVGLLFLVGGILAIGNIRSTFSKKMHVTALFDDVSGLQQGNNIWFSGVKIGTVKNVKFYGSSQVRVTLNIDIKAQQYIRKDAKVKVSTDGFIGNKILVISGGSSKFEAIEDGDTLTVEHTFSTDDMMNTLQESNRNMLSITGDVKTLSARLAKGEGSVGKLLKDETLYNDLVVTSASLRKASQGAEALMGSLTAFGTQLNKKGGLMHELATDTAVFASVKATALQLNRIADTASAVLSTFQKASNSTTAPLGILLHDESTGAHLKATAKNLESGSRHLDEDLEGLQHTILLKRYFKKKEKKDSVK